MAEEEIEDEPRVEEKSASRFPWIEKLLIELLRTLFFSLIAFGMIYFVTNRLSTREEASEQLMLDRQFEDIPTPRPIGAEWPMEEMIINTADEFSSHFVKANIVVSYEPANPDVASMLAARKSEIHSEVRKIVGSKLFADIKNVSTQSLLAEEIKTRIQNIIGMPGIIDVFIIDFTVQ